MMMLRYLFVLILLTIGGCYPEGKVLAEREQVLVVLTNGGYAHEWEPVKGTMLLYERNEEGFWECNQATIPVVVGKHGMAWGLGRHFKDTFLYYLEEHKKVEGDGKAPAGIFNISTVFSKDPQLQCKMPLYPITNTTEAIDDPKSRYYNQLVDTKASTISKDWDSAEKMAEIDLYDVGIVIDHNVPPPSKKGGFLDQFLRVKNPEKEGFFRKRFRKLLIKLFDADKEKKPAGSCTFIHEWHSPTTGTNGGTAMSKENLMQVVQWLDPAKKPAIIQLPVRRYEDLRHKYRVPILPREMKQAIKY